MIWANKTGHKYTVNLETFVRLLFREFSMQGLEFGNECCVDFVL